MNLNTEQKFIIVKGAGGGGLGDRIRCVLAGVAYAKLTDRTLFIDWSDAKLIPSTRNIFYDLFVLSDIDFVDDCPVSTDVWPIVWRGRLKQSLHTLYTEYDPEGWDRTTAINKFSFDQSKLDYSQQILVMWEFDQFTELAKFSQSDSFELSKALILKHLSPSQNIRSIVDSYKRDFFPKEAPIIGVHIRATNEFESIKSTVTLDQYLVAVEKLLKNLNSEAKIFLATDNSSVVSALERKFPGRIIARNKWFAEPGERLHFNSDCPEPEQALVDAMVEMLLLAECDYLIYQQNSSFGRCAHMFSKTADGQIKPLFVKQKITRKIRNKLTNFFKS